MKNALSVDLESWVHCFRDTLKLEAFAADPAERKALDRGYLPEATRRILDLLGDHGQTATFFVAGEIYDWYPDLVEEIARRGHEIGYHTHHHTPLSRPGILEQELIRSRRFLEDFRPIGFRAPMIYIREDDMAVLERWSFRYSSSTYDRRDVFRSRGIDEIPVSTFGILGPARDPDRLPKHLTPRMLLREFPFGGAIVFPVLGAWTSRFIDARNRQGRSSSLYVHPWQLFRTPEIASLRFKARLLLRNPLCLPYAKSALGAFRHLLVHHEFTSFEKLYGSRWR